MNPYKNAAILLAASIVCLFMLWIQSIGTAPAPLADFRVDWTAEEIDALEIERGGVTAAARRNSGGWRLSGPFEARADSAAVDRAVDAAVSLEPSAAVSFKELRKMDRTISEFGLSPAAFAVTIRSGRAVKKYFFGSRTPDGSSVYVRAADIDAVFTVPAKSIEAFPMSSDGFRDRSLVRIDAEKVTGFEVKAPDMPFLRVARGARGWRIEQPESAAAAQEAVAAALARIESARAESFVLPSAGSVPGTGVLRPSELAPYGLSGRDVVRIAIRSGRDVSEISFGGPVAGATNLVYALVHDGTAVVAADASAAALFSGGVKTFRDTRLFPLDADPSSVTFSSGGKIWTVAKDASRRWRMISPSSAPADDAAVASIVDSLLRLREEDVSGAGAQDGVRVSVTLAPPYGAQPAFTVSPESFGGIQALDAMRSRTVLALDESLVSKITAVSGGVTNSIVRNAVSGGWSIQRSEGEPAPDTRRIERLDAFMRAVANVEAAAVESLSPTPDDRRRFGFDSPFAVITIDMSSGESLRKNLVIGARTGGGRYATVGGTDAVFALSASTAEALTGLFAN